MTNCSKQRLSKLARKGQGKAGRGRGEQGGERGEVRQGEGRGDKVRTERW